MNGVCLKVASQLNMKAPDESPSSQSASTVLTSYFAGFHVYYSENHTLQNQRGKDGGALSPQGLKECNLNVRDKYLIHGQEFLSDFHYFHYFRVKVWE